MNFGFCFFWNVQNGPYSAPCLSVIFTNQDSVVGEGRDMDADEVKALAQGVAAIDMGL